MIVVPGKPTPRQRDLHAWMLSFQRLHSMPPTLREIMSAFGFKSTNAASDHLRYMQKKGLVVHRPLLARGWLAVPPQQEGAAA
jgi:SOS-response transcriptional repressor LexA